ncbi:MAG: hypothetical protein LBJ89_02790 [Holosporales bacterium]|jgi:hypothetical protein|nr:hypothetical protein [Holosporales bacterium]
MKELCCRDFNKFLSDNYIPIEFRENDGDDDRDGNMFVFDWNIDGYPCYCPIFFCPWCGKEFETTFVFVLRYRLFVKLDVKEADCADFSLETKIPEEFNHLKKRDWFDADLEKDRNEHKNGGHCSSLEYSLEEDNPVIYMQNIRTYGILKERNFKDGYWVEGNKAEYCDFEPINYCNSCGVNFPEKLDKQLTEILQKEYGLESWRDYKKAPAQFHTDEWWRKRGL